MYNKWISSNWHRLKNKTKQTKIFGICHWIALHRSVSKNTRKPFNITRDPCTKWWIEMYDFPRVSNQLRPEPICSMEQYKRLRWHPPRDDMRLWDTFRHIVSTFAQRQYQIGQQCFPIWSETCADWWNLWFWLGIVPIFRCATCLLFLSSSFLCTKIWQKSSSLLFFTIDSYQSLCLKNALKFFPSYLVRCHIFKWCVQHVWQKKFCIKFH